MTHLERGVFLGVEPRLHL